LKITWKPNLLRAHLRKLVLGHITENIMASGSEKGLRNLHGWSQDSALGLLLKNLLSTEDA